MTSAPRRGITPGLPTNTGSFKATERAESGVSLADVPGSDDLDLSTWTPVDIDTELYRLYGEISTLRTRRASEYEFLSGEIARRVFNRGWKGRATREEVAAVLSEIEETRPEDRDYQQKEFLKRWEHIEDYDAKIEGLSAEEARYDAEFRARGGWTRAFLVTNGNGHVHSSTNCSTCFAPGYDGAGNWREGTKFHWVTELSNHDESEVIEKAGSDACSVCFPHAPRDRARSIFSPDEVDKAKAREERAAAAQKRTADKIAKGLTQDGSEFKIEWLEESGGHDLIPGTRDRQYVVRPRPHRESFKTEQAATQWLVQQMIYDRYWPDHKVSDGEMGGREEIVQAIMRKHNKTRDEVMAEIDKKVAAKAKREGLT